MKIRSFEEMLKEYQIEVLDTDDNEAREKLLLDYNYSVIFEGDFLEYDQIEKWIKNNIGRDEDKFVFYGKLAYDYGFFELFFSKEEYKNIVADKIPGMYTTYPSGKTFKTDGWDKILYLNGTEEKLG